MDAHLCEDTLEDYFKKMWQRGRKLLDLVRCEFTKLKRRKITLMLIVLSCFFPLIVVMTTKNGMSGDLSTHYLKMRFDLSFTMTQGYGLVFLAPCLIGSLRQSCSLWNEIMIHLKILEQCPWQLPKWSLQRSVYFLYMVLFLAWRVYHLQYSFHGYWRLVLYMFRYKLGFSIIFGLVITIASLPIVVIIVYFNKSYLVSTLLAFLFDSKLGNLSVYLKQWQWKVPQNF